MRAPYLRNGNSSGVNVSGKRRRARRAAKRLVCAAIIAVAGLTCVWKAHEDLPITASLLQPRSIADSTLNNGSWQCVYRAIRHAVPEGTPVYLYSTRKNQIFFQHTAEVATPWAMPELSRSAARWELSVTHVPRHRYCSGLKLKVTRT